MRFRGKFEKFLRLIVKTKCEWAVLTFLAMASVLKDEPVAET